MPGRDLVDEAMDLVEAATARGLVARLLGGVAFRVKVPGWAGRPIGPHPDIDLAIASRDRSGFTGVLTDAGYLADRQHNVLHGDRQLFFYHPAAGHSVDVIVDRLVMCHTLDLRGRLLMDAPTLPAADLLLSKLQVVRLNTKDAIDSLALLAALPLADADGPGISIERLIAVTSSDWGWWRTVVGNLGALADVVDQPAAATQTTLDPDQLLIAADRIRELSRRILESPKSLRWRLRAAVGERVRWYEEPEEVEHVRND